MQALINNGITEECHVVYLLSCIRKIIEQENTSTNFRTLKFYCHWALHSKLQGRLAQDMLAHLNTVDFSSASTSPPPIIQNFSRFQQLIEQIEIFLQEYQISLPENTSDNWARFILLYASVIEDCPLVINNNNREHAQIVKVTVKVEIAQSTNLNQQDYCVRWIFTGRQGNEREIYTINSFEHHTEL